MKIDTSAINEAAESTSSKAQRAGLQDRVSRQIDEVMERANRGDQAARKLYRGMLENFSELVESHADALMRSHAEEILAPLELSATSMESRLSVFELRVRALSGDDPTPPEVLLAGRVAIAELEADVLAAMARRQPGIADRLSKTREAAERRLVSCARALTDARKVSYTIALQMGEDRSPETRSA